jgi:hypothetical protein
MSAPYAHLEETPAYKAARAKLDDITKEKSSLEEKLNKAREPKGIRDQAARFLRGESLADTFDIAAAGRRLSLLGAAIEMQTEALVEIRGRLSRSLCEALQADLPELARERIRLARKISDSLARERVLRDSLQAAGYEVKTLPPLTHSLTVDDIGVGTDGETTRLLRQAVREGLFAANDPVVSLLPIKVSSKPSSIPTSKPAPMLELQPA